MELKNLVEQFPIFLGGSPDAPVFSTGQGLVLTLELLSISSVIGFALAVPLALARNSSNWLLSRSVWLYTGLFRGTPLLVQLFMLYYGLAQWPWIRESWAWPYLREAYGCAILAFTLNTAAYIAEILAGQIRNTPHGEVEAARSLGMNHWLLLRRIVLPSALRRALPAYSNEVIMLMHATSVASLVTLADLTGIARQIYAETYNPFEPFLIAGIFYLVLTNALAWIFRRMEKHWLAYLRPREAH
ncbi:ABC transporter permease [Verminephrobacter eiseniae]|uniref:ABC transporter permease n=1 Tax=Verminephrobacter eiseniae TaxID=364317 RepID=UPI0022384885|nr:ABC transporter permease [Verminephrobacter eiseniae]MCW5262866.1 ABC transporter permease [Verminephrobacter eiseniae]